MDLIVKRTCVLVLARVKEEHLIFNLQFLGTEAAPQFCVEKNKRKVWQCQDEIWNNYKKCNSDWLSVALYISIYIYIYVCVCMYVCVYIYIYTHTHTLSLIWYIDIYIYIVQTCFEMASPFTVQNDDGFKELYEKQWCHWFTLKNHVKYWGNSYLLSSMTIVYRWVGAWFFFVCVHVICGQSD